MKAMYFLMLLVLVSCGIKVDLNGERETSHHGQNPEGTPMCGGDNLVCGVEYSSWLINYTEKLPERISLELIGAEILNECRGIHHAKITRKGAGGTILIQGFPKMSNSQTASLVIRDCHREITIFDHVDVPYQAKQLNGREWRYTVDI